MAVPFSADLAERVQQQYPRIGVNPNGSYVGSKLFKRRLMDIYPHEVGPIRLAVNHMVKFGQLPVDRYIQPEPSQLPQPPQPPVLQYPSQTLEDWVREQRPIHGLRPNGPALGWRKLATKLRPIIPQQLASEVGRLDMVVRDLLREVNETTETIEGDFHATVVDPLEAIREIPRGPRNGMEWDNSVPGSFTAAAGGPPPTLGGPSSSTATGQSYRITRLYFEYLPAYQVRSAPSPLGLNSTKLSHYFMESYVWHSGQTYVCIWATESVLEFFVESTARDTVVQNMEMNTPFQYLANWDALDPQNYGYSSHDGGAETLVKWKVVDRMAEICVKSITMANNTKQMIEEYVAKWVGGFGPGREFSDMLASRINEIRSGGGNIQSNTSESLPHLGAALHPLSGSRSLVDDINEPLKRPNSLPPIPSLAPPLPFSTASHITELPEQHFVQPNGHLPPAVNGFSANVTGYPGGVHIENQEGENFIPQQPTIPRNAKIAAALGTSGDDNDDEMQENGPSLDEQMCLLSLGSSQEGRNGSELASNDVKNAVLFTSDVLNGNRNRKLLPQYGLIGEVQSSGMESVSDDPRLFVNTNHPWSFFVVGLQGSGKSYSLSCLLENCLLPTRTLGILKRPLSALVFHFSQYTSRLNFRPCEAAFIAVPDPKFQNQYRAVPVTVLVSPSNFLGLQSAYSQIPGVAIKPLRLRPSDLNIGSMLTLMSVDQSSNTPLYMSTVTKLLREMASTSSDFDFLEFKQRLAVVKMMPLQRKPLEQRLELLESFLDLENAGGGGFDFEDGSITIVDLSCPFVDENTACVLFNICLGVFLQDSSAGAGKVIAVDEAHKYITTSPASKVLTESLLQLIRQQRHYGARIIISTQEPTIDVRLMDLCSVTLIHRFTSPEWFNVLRKHVSVVEDDSKDSELFRRIIDLRVGEGLLFAPSAVVSRNTILEEHYPTGEDDGFEDDRKEGIEKLGSRFLKAKIRRRLTADGGKSIVCV